MIEKRRTWNASYEDGPYQYRWILYAGNNFSIAESEWYFTTPASARRAARLVQKRMAEVKI